MGSIKVPIQKGSLNMKLLNKLWSKQKKHTIEFCEKNLDRFLTDENFSSYDQFFNTTNIQYKEYECQSRCKDCKNTPYAIVNGEVITADDSQELLEAMKRITNNE